MRILIRIQLLLVLLVNTLALSAHSEGEDIILTVRGSGTTLQEANQSALRNAIQQAYGAFISSKTEILNDIIIADQMASVSSGNISNYEVLNETQVANNWITLVKVKVSIDKLTNFAQSKGLTVDVKGGLFANNIRQQRLNEEGEFIIVSEMTAVLHDIFQRSFNYKIDSGQPKSLNGSNENWKIPLSVSTYCNDNIEVCSQLFTKTFSSIASSESEIETYKSIGKKLYRVSLLSNKNRYEFYLRNPNSLLPLNEILSLWRVYINMYVINSELGETYGNWSEDYVAFDRDNSRNKMHTLGYRRGYVGDGGVIDGPFIDFPSKGQVVLEYNWLESATITQIEKLTGFKIKPDIINGEVPLPIKYGGYLIFEDDEKYLIAANSDICKFINLDSAKNKCSVLMLNGYSDWHVPSVEELKNFSMRTSHLRFHDCNNCERYDLATDYVTEEGVFDLRRLNYIAQEKHWPEGANFYQMKLTDKEIESCKSYTNLAMLRPFRLQKKK